MSENIEDKSSNTYTTEIAWRVGPESPGPFIAEVFNLLHNGGRPTVDTCVAMRESIQLVRRSLLPTPKLLPEQKKAAEILLRYMLKFVGSPTAMSILRGPKEGTDTSVLRGCAPGIYRKNMIEFMAMVYRGHIGKCSAKTHKAKGNRFLDSELIQQLEVQVETWQ
jgi:hypothetical protein